MNALVSRLRDAFPNWIVNGLLVLVCLFAVINGDVVVGESGVTRTHVFWMLAALPGVAALVCFWISEAPRYRRRSADIDEWLKSLTEDDQRDLRTKNFRDFVQRIQVDAETGKPRFAYTFFGALALTMVFGVAAELSSGPNGIGVLRGEAPSAVSAKAGAMKGAAEKGLAGAPELSATGPSSATKEAATNSSRPPASSDATNGDNPQKPLATGDFSTVGDGKGEDRGSESRLRKKSRTADDTKREGAHAEESRPEDEGLRGLVYAAYGAYLYAISLFIGRLGSGSVSGKFLVRLALRCASSVVLGFVAGELQIFRTIATSN